MTTETTPKLIEFYPGFFLVLRIWVAQTWRMILWFIVPFLLSMLAGFVIGIIAAATGGKDAVKPFAQALGGIIGLGGGFWAYWMALGQVLRKRKSFAGHRLVLLTPEGARLLQGKLTPPSSSPPPAGADGEVWSDQA